MGLTVDDLEQWVASGAHWRVVDISAERVVVDLCACTGESMERACSEDPAVIGYLRTAPSVGDGAADGAPDGDPRRGGRP
jgi:hypothetical protein